jgi:hypothetical protein
LGKLLDNLDLQLEGIDEGEEMPVVRAGDIGKSQRNGHMWDAQG